MDRKWGIRTARAHTSATKTRSRGGRTEGIATSRKPAQHVIHQTSGCRASGPLQLLPVTNAVEKKRTSVVLEYTGFTPSSLSLIPSKSETGRSCLGFYVLALRPVSVAVRLGVHRSRPGGRDGGGQAVPVSVPVRLGVDLKCGEDGERMRGGEDLGWVQLVVGDGDAHAARRERVQQHSGEGISA
jgi:hypothetical protein